MNPTSSAPVRLRLFAITWPIFIENALMVAMGLFGLWMASRVSDGAVATYGLANQVVGAMQIIFRVASIGTSVVVTQYQGAGDPAGARAVARSGLAASVWVGLATLLLVGLGATAILSVLNLPPPLWPVGEPYLQVLALALAGDAVAMTMIAILRAGTFTREAMQAVLLMNLVQVALSFPLMFGLGGWEGLGLAGLGWAMVVSRMFALVLLWRMWGASLGVWLRGRDWLLAARAPLRSILHIGLPGAGEKVAYRVAFIMTVAMVAGMGQAELATHAYVWQSVALVTLFSNSVSFGTEIVVGHRVGAGELRRTRRVIWQAMAWAMVVTVVCTLASFALTPLLIARATQDPQVLALVAAVMVVELVLEPGRTFNLIITSGLRAAGDVRFPVKVSAVVVFVCGAGLAWLLGVHLGMGLVGVWIGYTADEWGRGLAMAARWYWLGWVPHARATRRRILRQRGSID